jgi:hypothetical protein
MGVTVQPLPRLSLRLERFGKPIAYPASLLASSMMRVTRRELAVCRYGIKIRV